MTVEAACGGARTDTLTDSGPTLEVLGREVTAPDRSRHLDRHLSWLDLTTRLLRRSEDPSLPPLERAALLGAVSHHLDQLFQLRVSTLRDRAGVTAGDQLAAIHRRVTRLVTRQLRGLAQARPSLRAAGVHLCDHADLDSAGRAALEQAVDEQVLPAMPTASASPRQALARAASLSLQLLVVVADPGTGMPCAVRLEVPRQLPRFLALPERTGWVPVEQALAAHLGRLLPGMPVLGHHTFRVTRDARQSLVTAGVGNLVTAVEAMMQRRRRFARVVRLEVDASMPRAVLRTLVRELEVAERDVYRVRGLLDLGGLLDLHDPAGAERRGPPAAPARASRRRRIASRPSPDVLGATERGDILLHHPYEAHAISVEAFLEQAARDPDVLAIKQTLCRSSERVGPVVGSLVRAAEAGKEVVALVELTTRLHESASIAVARLLTQAGAHVVHGATGLTTHTTLTLVVRRAVGGVRRYCHIGTGSSTQDTPLLREDLSLLSADAALGADVADLFNHLTGGGRPPRFRRLLVAPSTLRRDLLELIGGQSVPGGRIVLKVNHLGDPGIVEALYAASAAGARVDLIVRGICGLRPGVRGLSDRIRVRSLVSRWPEHSRILGFGAGAEARWYIGSADLLSRNLGSRVEVLAPVADPRLRTRLAEIVEVLLTDDTVAWRLGADGRWRRVESRRGVCAQERLLHLAGPPPAERRDDGRRSLGRRLR